MAKIDKLEAGAQSHLEPGEEIQATIQGTYEVKVLGKDSVRTGLLCATDRRVVFFAKKLGGFDLEAFPYKSISSLEQAKSLMGNSVSFFASGNKVSMKWIKDGKALEAFMAIVRERMNESSLAPAASAPAPAPDAIDQLRKLGELRDAGIVTEAEFEAKKAELLGRL